MSGGVDSSVAAYLLTTQGYDVTGCTLRLYDYTGMGLPEQNTCCGLSEVNDARAVADRLGIPFQVVNLMTEFRQQVMDPFTASYLRGDTPNPCINCNRYLKFGQMLDWALANGFDYIATGHYAQRVQLGGRWYLRKGVDPTRDQSYVLYPITQAQLAHVLLPLGGLYKQQDVRRIAEEQGFVNAHKHDSEDICFVPDGDYAGFMERTAQHLPGPGDIIDQSGHVLGQHRGAQHFTIGQRKGLGLALPAPAYVLAKDMARNTVTIGPNEALWKTTLEADDWFWMRTPPKPGESFRASAKIRYAHKEQPATITLLPAGAEVAEGTASATTAAPIPAATAETDTAPQQPDNHSAVIRVVFDAPQRALTTGQAVVLYDGDLVLGGGTIRRVLD